MNDRYDRRWYAWVIRQEPSLRRDSVWLRDERKDDDSPGSPLSSSLDDGSARPDIRAGGNGQAGKHRVQNMHPQP